MSIVRIGNTVRKIEAKKVTGEYVKIAGEHYYKIGNYDQLRPFFMSIVSDSDHWLFISSNGPLTAGRRNPETALFPYYTDDKIHDSVDLTGSKTILKVELAEETCLWEPFSNRYDLVYRLERNLYKNVYGNKLIFEEINHDLGVSFRYGWFNSEEFGLVRKAWCKYLGDDPRVAMEILDGIQNVLPAGVDTRMQNERSTLMDAYKKSELLPGTGLGLFMLSAIPVDRAEPSESLKANTVWSLGADQASHLLSSVQLDRFRHFQPVEEEVDVRAERGAYFLHFDLAMTPGAERSWYIVAEVNQGPAEVARLNEQLKHSKDLAARLEADIEKGSRNLARIVGSADGLQLTADLNVTYRHFSNVLFNVMRGGIFVDHYALEKADLLKFLRQANRHALKKHASFFDALPDRVAYPDLLARAGGVGDPQLERLCYEYLPLTFSRRHGDPSRPWNRFSIDIREADGSQKLYYQGNWRDIFQNWEALGLSYPGFLESMISKFVNASTPDGYNPYRITRDGIDWEVIEPDDPWSYIGYWGDHQIIYLLKLLELSRHHHPGALEQFLTRDLFAYANVPYRIRPYEALLADPQDTVDFDHELEAVIQQRVAETGADGKLYRTTDGEIYLVNLTEKLLVSLLAKLSNFIPEGGIWLNTQRPEWNDANNALVGNGVSMVTLYYIRRFLVFSRELFGNMGKVNFSLSEEVVELLAVVTTTFEQHAGLLKGKLTDRDRKTVMDGLGQAGSRYRSRLYGPGFSGKRKEVTTQDLLRLFEIALAYTDHAIRANERDDKLYHAYNLMTVENDQEVSISYLYEMLEGQVAVLSSGFLSAGQTLVLLEALRKSTLYRADQHTYLLYPDRHLPRFEEKNNIPAEAAQRSALIRKLVADGNRQLVVQDVTGQYHFNGSFNNANSVKEALAQLEQQGYRSLVEKERALILDIFEQIFDHKSFTGRSGTFFGYEGLGCIYWHMVSKLILAVEENCYQALAAGEDKETIDALIRYYYDVRAGLGFNKTPEEYGAFPSDPYSHTPGNAGAQQPGMTGQVKEDILSRFGELGVVIGNGRIGFRPELLQPSEFLAAPGSFAYFDLAGEHQSVELPAGTLAFTYCQTPVVYHRSKEAGITVTRQDGSQTTYDGMELNAEDSLAIFGRTGAVRRVDVRVDVG